MNNKPLKPAETLDVCIETGIAKANNSIARLFLLGIMAGASTPKEDIDEVIQKIEILIKRGEM